MVIKSTILTEAETMRRICIYEGILYDAPEIIYYKGNKYVVTDVWDDIKEASITRIVELELC